MAEEHKAMFQGWFAEFNKGNVAGADLYIAPDNVLHDARVGEISGLDAFKEHVASWKKAFPDAQVAIEDLISEGDKVIVRVTCRGTHQGECMGIAPTGKQVCFSGFVCARAAEGKFIEGWQIMDTHSLMQQLGPPVPAPQPAPAPEPVKVVKKEKPKPKPKPKLRAKPKAKPKKVTKPKASKKPKAKRSRR